MGFSNGKLRFIAPDKDGEYIAYSKDGSEYKCTFENGAAKNIPDDAEIIGYARIVEKQNCKWKEEKYEIFDNDYGKNMNRIRYICIETNNEDIPLGTTRDVADGEERKVKFSFALQPKFVIEDISKEHDREYKESQLEISNSKGVKNDIHR